MADKLYSIRAAKESDVPQIQKFYQELIEYEKKVCKSEYQVESNWADGIEGYNYFLGLMKKGMLFVAVHEEEVIGFLCFGFIRKTVWASNSVAEIIHLYVKEDKRGLGVGTLFVDFVKQKCAENNVSHIKTIVLSDSDDSIGFYKKMGLISYENIMFCNVANKKEND